MIEIEKYFSAVLDNKIPACEKLKQAADKILQDYNPGGSISTRNWQTVILIL